MERDGWVGTCMDGRTDGLSSLPVPIFLEIRIFLAFFPQAGRGEMENNNSKAYALCAFHVSLVLGC